MGRQVAGRLRSAAEPGPSGQELAVAAEHTCELRAWRGRPPARPLRRWPRARPPADTVFPRSEHHAHKRARPATALPPPEETRGEGGINRERAKGQTRHPRPRAHTGGNRNVTHLRARRFQGPLRACSLDAGEAPSPSDGQPLRRPGGTSRAALARGPRPKAHPGAHPAPGSPSPPTGPGRAAPARGAGLAPAQSTGCCLFVRTPWAALALGDAQTRGCWRLPGSPLPHGGSAPAAGQRRGERLLPLGGEMPGRLPPGVAASRGPQQEKRDAGGPEEQSGPHDRRRLVPPARLGSGAARGGGGCRPSPLLLAPQGANQRAPSWHAESSRGAGGLREEGPGAARGRAGRLGGGGWSLAPPSETHKRQSRPPAGGLLGRRGAQRGGKDQGPLGAGF